MASLKIRNTEIADLLIGKKFEFPKYSTQILNLVNQNAQGTRPIIVGQMSELIQACPHKDHSKWKEWYLKQKPDAIDKATEKIFSKLEEMKVALNQIDKTIVRNYVEDLVINKTFTGLCFQEAILKKIAESKKGTYKLANPKEESKGIDGYIDDIPVSIKPITYKSKSGLQESISAKMIYYDKQKDGLIIEFDF